MRTGEVWLARRSWLGRALGTVLGAALARVHAAETGLAIVAAAAGTPGSPGTVLPATIGVDDLARIYRRQQQFMAGTRLQPVNLPAAHPLRRWFSQQVLGSAPDEQEAYWRTQYFNGVVPPFVLASEEAVLRFVAGTPGAIGYVASCVVDRRVRVLLTIEGGPGCAR